MKTDYLAWIIKVAAIVTAAPRWIGALLAAEGFALPVEWLVWWVPLSAILSACMAVVEGLAFAYVFEAWRNQTDRDAKDLLWFALLSACVFVVVLAPYIAASVTHRTLASILTWEPALYAWAVCVGLSTIAIVASVGYAQKRKAPKASAQAPRSETQEQITPAHVCAVCGVGYEKQTSLAAHMKVHMRVHANGKAA